MSNFYEVVTEAVNDVVDHGFDSQKRIDDWIVKLRAAALASLVPEAQIERSVSDTLKTMYQRLVTKGKILETHSGISTFTFQQLKPRLRNELDRRIMANTALVKLNREAAVDSCIRRFAGWSTSIPAGGSDQIDKVETKKVIRKSLAQLPFEERRLAIDQGHKFASALNSVIAVDGGAIAAIWHSHWRQAGYKYRPDHKERDLRVYAIKGNWALEKGLMKPGPDGYTNGITQPAEEPFCRCNYQYIYNVASLPPEMLTEKGRIALAEARKK